MLDGSLCILQTLPETVTNHLARKLLLVLIQLGLANLREKGSNEKEFPKGRARTGRIRVEGRTAGPAAEREFRG